jgi:hypothetical protein
MTEDEVRALLRAHGWNWRLQPRKGHPYLYARRRKKGAARSKFEERYIAPVSRLPYLTETDIVAKLTRVSQPDSRSVPGDAQRE